MIRKLKTNDWLNFLEYCLRINDFDFGLQTKDVKVIHKQFRYIMKTGKFCRILDGGKEIHGIMYVDKNNLRIHADTSELANKLLKVLNWNFKFPVFANFHKYNKFGRTLNWNGFRVLKVENDRIYSSNEQFLKEKRDDQLQHNNFRYQNRQSVTKR